MSHKISSILFLSISLIACFSSGAAGQDDYRPIAITSVESITGSSGNQVIKISWENLLGGGVEFYVSYSSDGKAFDRILASKLDTCEYTWASHELALFGWIKVKGYRDGYLVGESAAPLNLVPSDCILVSKGDQKVFHFADGKLADVFTCSTALPQYDLKEGRYGVYLREKKHWSREWEVWMPHSLFFHRGYALHATTMVRQLGRPASHGCVRLRPKDAEKLYNEVTVGTPVIVLPKSIRCDTLLAQYAADKAKPQQQAAVTP